MDSSEDLELISVEELFEPHLPEEDFELRPGKKIRIRALSRAESIRAQKLEENRAKQEQYLLSVAVVAPVLTEADVARWQRSARIMDVEEVARAINRLSGVGADAVKSDLHDDGDEPVSGV